MKPVIDYDGCEGCGTCVEYCPDVFALGDDEKAFVKEDAKLDSCDLEEAVNTCPTECITLVD